MAFRDAVDRLQHGRRCQRRHRDQQGEIGKRANAVVFERARQGAQAHEDQQGADELAEMRRNPVSVGSIFAEGGGRIIRIGAHGMQHRGDKQHDGAEDGRA
jgi:hypothetical protein